MKLRKVGWGRNWALRPGAGTHADKRRKRRRTRGQDKRNAIKEGQ